MEILIDDPRALIEKHRRAGLLLDSNLLLLFIVGLSEPSLIGRGKLSQYDKNDFAILHSFVSAFPTLVTTPHILTEVSNLLGDFPPTEKRRTCFMQFARLASAIQENLDGSRAAAQRAELPFLGLTDCAIAELADRFVILSNDARMVVKLHEAGRDAINFNHFRDELQRLV